MINNSCFGNIYSHYEVKVKLDHVLFSLAFQITHKPMAWAKRELFIYMAFGRHISKR